MDGQITTTAHPEEIECVRMPQPDGTFSPDKRYEYTYATRKSLEFIPALGRKDWRYFTNKGFTYAGKWLRSEQRGWGDGGKCWEVFLDDRVGTGGKENVVSWDYDATLCWRECPYVSNDDFIIGAVTRKVMDEMIAEVERVSPTIHQADTKATTAAPAPAPAPEPWSLIRCVFGIPCKCAPFDTAEITTMEAKYRWSANIAEFWCFLTSVFYGSSLLLYFVKEEDWFERWRELGGWPVYIHFPIVIAVMVMLSSAIYHACLIECIGCVDCFFASFLYASATMTVFGVDVVTQIGALLLLGVLHLNAWRYITRFAILIMSVTIPFALLSYTRMKSYYGVAFLIFTITGSSCFVLDRMGIAPLHSVWHVLSGTAVALTLYYVVVNGTVSNVRECEFVV
jgi:hypothetical protein